ncbi:hypothetical protein D3C72_1484550 [compost metagenome]
MALVEQPAIGREAVLVGSRQRILGRQAVFRQQGPGAEGVAQPCSQARMQARRAEHEATAMQVENHAPRPGRVDADPVAGNPLGAEVLAIEAGASAAQPAVQPGEHGFRRGQFDGPGQARLDDAPVEPQQQLGAQAQGAWCFRSRGRGNQGMAAHASYPCRARRSGSCFSASPARAPADPGCRRWSVPVRRSFAAPGWPVVRRRAPRSAAR